MITKGSKTLVSNERLDCKIQETLIQSLHIFLDFVTEESWLFKFVFKLHLLFD